MRKKHKTIDLSFLDAKLNDGDTISLKRLNPEGFIHEDGNLKKFKFVSVDLNAKYTMEACNFCCFSGKFKNCYVVIPCAGGYFIEQKYRNNKNEQKI